MRWFTRPGRLSWGGLSEKKHGGGVIARDFADNPLLTLIKRGEPPPLIKGVWVVRGDSDGLVGFPHVFAQ